MISNPSFLQKSKFQSLFFNKNFDFFSESSTLFLIRRMENRTKHLRKSIKLNQERWLANGEVVDVQHNHIRTISRLTSCPSQTDGRIELNWSAHFNLIKFNWKRTNLAHFLVDFSETLGCCCFFFKEKKNNCFKFGSGAATRWSSEGRGCNWTELSVAATARLFFFFFFVYFFLSPVLSFHPATPFSLVSPFFPISIFVPFYFGPSKLYSISFTA